MIQKFNDNFPDVGVEMYSWASEMFGFNRSLTGSGVRKTLEYIKELLPELEISSVKSGTKAFDWEVPTEWNLDSAAIYDSAGNILISTNETNLRVVGYSVPIDRIVDAEELSSHLYSLPNQIDAIPYVTSYYQENWGFCIKESEKVLFNEGPFRVQINATRTQGEMVFGELLIQGESKEEVFLSTYICHPSLANDNLSGIVVSIGLIRYLKSLKSLKYSYRIIFIPETIGAIYYLSQHLHNLKKNTIAGWTLTCLGDDGNYSYLPSRNGNTLSDRISVKVLEDIDPNYCAYNWNDRGSDERQYCAPGIDLPIASIMRSKYATYPEYHTSLDNLTFISPEGLSGGFNALKNCIIILESNAVYSINTLGEPQLGKRGLYNNISMKNTETSTRNLLNVISQLDGQSDLIQVSNIAKISYLECLRYIELLSESNLISKSKD